MVKHHRVAGVDGVGPWQELDSVLYGVCLFVVELQNRQTNERSHTLWIQLQGATERQTSFLQFVELDKAMAHSQPYLSYTWIKKKEKRQSDMTQIN